MKRNILVGITMMLLLALPAAASDYTLGIFGNANEDDTINMQDVTYTELIILEYRDETELSDAKYDGKINMQDVTQIELVILGKEKEITILDDTVTGTHPNGKPVTVKKPVNRIILLNTDVAEAIKVLDSEDKVVGVTSYIPTSDVFFPKLSKLPSVGKWNSLDVEAILSLNPDLIITYGGSSYSEKTDNIFKDLPVTVVKLPFYEPESMAHDMEKVGYILGKVERAHEYIDFEGEHMNTINEVVGGLSEDEKPRVYLEWATKPYGTYSKTSGAHQMCIMAGGINIAADLPGGSFPKVDEEWVIVKNPDIIFKHQYGGSGYEEDDPSEMIERWAEVMNRTELANVAAVKDGRVCLLASDILYSPGYVAGIMYMAKWFHPELFEDVDPQAIHQEYLDIFHEDLDYSVTEHGVWVYPPLEIDYP
ncbi:MAG: ABC transporter substrate-binding protein [Euryarchaeota archaeon]|nr:ABC transporter substrate-binding protein [Euryarchaeota archaeon]